MPKETFQLIYSRLLLVLLSVVLFLFAACSSSAPSESEGKKFVDDWDAEVNLYRVKTFTKTNGMGNDRTYTMEYVAELECLKSNAIPNTVFRGSFRVECQNAGQLLEIKGKLVFEKTENGWRVIPSQSN